MTNGIEVRYKPDSTDIDEILLWQNGKCLFHLEYMDNNQVWMGLNAVNDKGEEVSGRVWQCSLKPIITTIEVENEVEGVIDEPANS